MSNHEKNKESVENPQEIQQDFKGYVKSIPYKSDEYQNIMRRRIFLSLKGFKSHSQYFDVMTKDGNSYHINNKGLTLLNCNFNCDKLLSI